jgi:hypothetical protein
MAKREVLEYIEAMGAVDSAGVAAYFGLTAPGAASILLKFSREGLLERERMTLSVGGGAVFKYVYRLSARGADYLAR